MKKLILFVSLIAGFQVYAQKEITINFDNEYDHTNVRGKGFNVVYKLKNNQVYVKHDTSFHTITPPKKFNPKNPVYGYLFFIGAESGILSRSILFVVDDYTTEFPNIFVDFNNNLDFTDDGTSLKYEQDSSVIVSLKNLEVPNAKAVVKLSRLKMPEGDQKKQVEEYLLPKGIHAQNSEALPIDYWFSDERKANRIKALQIKGKEARIGLHDFDVNGLFNNKGKDLIMIGDTEKNFISHRRSEGAIVYDDQTLLSINGQTYEVLEIEPTGRYLKLIESDKEYTAGLSVGSMLPENPVKILDSPFSIGLSSLVGRDNKYTLLEAWGTWCKPCTIHLPDLKKLANDHKDKLMIIGLNYGDKPEKAIAFFKEHEVKWANGVLSEELKEKLKVTGFPTYILVDPQGKVALLNGSLSQIDKLLSQQ